MNVTVVGASGYMGGELLRILAAHPEVEGIVAISRTYAGKAVSELYPNLRGVLDMKFSDLNLDKIDSGVVFFAAPPGEWLKNLPGILEKGIKVITLGGKFRIQDPELDEKIYPGYRNDDLLKERVYGLPELYRKEIKKARFVTNPGCYPTSIILGLLPLKNLKDRVDLKRVVTISISGTTGAGRKASEFLHHPGVSGDLKPYKVLYHRHTPEIESILGETLQEKVCINFTPSVGDFSRGIYSFITVFTQQSCEDLPALYKDFYQHEPFVRIIEGEGEVPDLKAVVHSNFCDLTVKCDSEKGRILILSAIDNLTKGGSGQAIQNMNLMLGFKEDSGLKGIAGYP